MLLERIPQYASTGIITISEPDHYVKLAEMVDNVKIPTLPDF